MRVLSTILVTFLAATAGLLMCADACADESGISQKTFDTNRLHTIFTFRRGVLVHEVTVFFGTTALQRSWFELFYRNSFLDPATVRRENWVERFYADGQPVFVRSGFYTDYPPPLRTGASRLLSERYTGLSRAIVLQGWWNGTYPVLLHVGGEAFYIGDDGFYHLDPDCNAILYESVTIDSDFSIPALDQERRRHMTRAAP
jgi:hypothetical protein